MSRDNNIIFLIGVALCHATIIYIFLIDVASCRTTTIYFLIGVGSCRVTRSDTKSTVRLHGPLRAIYKNSENLFVAAPRDNDMIVSKRDIDSLFV
jgi:hypothetical protein